MEHFKVFAFAVVAELFALLCTIPQLWGMSRMPPPNGPNGYIHLWGDPNYGRRTPPSSGSTDGPVDPTDSGRQHHIPTQEAETQPLYKPTLSTSSDFDCTNITNAQSIDAAIQASMALNTARIQAATFAHAGCLSQSVENPPGIFETLQSESIGFRELVNRLAQGCDAFNHILGRCINVRLSLAELGVTPTTPTPPTPPTDNDLLAKVREKNSFTFPNSFTMCTNWAGPKAQALSSLLQGASFGKFKSCFDAATFNVGSTINVYSSDYAGDCKARVATQTDFDTVVGNLNHQAVIFQTCAGLVNRKLFFSMATTDTLPDGLINATSISALSVSGTELLPVTSTIDPTNSENEHVLFRKDYLDIATGPSGNSSLDASYAGCRENMNMEEDGSKLLLPVQNGYQLYWTVSESELDKLFDAKGGTRAGVEPYLANLRVRRGLCTGKIPLHTWLRAKGSDGVETLNTEQAVQFEFIPNASTTATQAATP